MIWAILSIDVSLTEFVFMLSLKTGVCSTISTCSDRKCNVSTLVQSHKGHLLFGKFQGGNAHGGRPTGTKVDIADFHCPNLWFYSFVLFVFIFSIYYSKNDTSMTI